MLNCDPGHYYGNTFELYTAYCRGRRCSSCPLDALCDEFDTDDCEALLNEHFEAALEAIGATEIEENFEFDESAFKNMMGLHM